MPIDPSHVKWDTIDPAKVQWENPSAQPQSIHNETTIYDPVSGVPISSSGGGESATGTTKTVADALRTTAALPIAFAAGASRPLATLARLLPGSGGKQMVQAQDQLVSGLKQATDSPYLVPAANLAGEITATAPVGGLIAKPMAAAFPRLAAAVGSGGFTTGTKVAPWSMDAARDLAIRSAGGALTGGVTAGLINPDDIGTGAGIGAAIPVAGKVLNLTGAIGSKILGGVTGVGDEALSQAYKAGKAGGDTAKAFRENMRGGVSMSDVMDMARQDLQAMSAQKQAAYRSGMTDITNDKTVLKFDGIENAIKNAFDTISFKGQVKNEKAAQALQQISDDVNEWKSLDAATYHTPEGLDALKQKVGAVLESIPYEQKTARKAAGDIYNAIKTEISNQAPTYSKVMSDYSKASDLISEIEKALSLGQKSSADTAMRKLQSLMRNNVNTSYGYRTNLANQLEQAGGQSLMPSIAGQALGTWTPRGLQKAASGAGEVGFALSGNLPAAAAIGAASSPRLVGEAYYGAGKLAGVLANKNPVSPQEVNQLAALLSQIPQRAYLYRNDSR